MKLILLSIAAILAIGVVASDFTHGQLNCYIDHLIGASRLKADFPKFSDGDSENLKCPEQLTAVRIVIFDLLKEKMNEKPGMAQYSSCMLKDLRANKLVNDLMLIMVYDAAPSVTKQERETIKNEVDTRIGNFFMEAVKNCVH